MFQTDNVYGGANICPPQGRRERGHTMGDGFDGAIGKMKVGNCTITEQPADICRLAAYGAEKLAMQKLGCDNGEDNAVCDAARAFFDLVDDTQAYKDVTAVGCSLTYSGFWVEQDGKDVLNHYAGKKYLPEALAMCAAKRPIRDVENLEKKMKIPTDYREKEKFLEDNSFGDRLLRAALIMTDKK